MKTVKVKDWKIPALLILVGLIPIIAGTVRLFELAGGADITPNNARFFASPTPVILHVISSTIYCMLGAFQFVPSLRHHKSGWHHLSGRLLVIVGIIAALSGLWMTHFYPLPAHDAELLYIFRMIFGMAMLLSLVLGVHAIARRAIMQHGAWMMRAYAIGLGAGTQAFILLLWFIIFGTPGETARALLMGAGWAINLLIVERILHNSKQNRRIKTWKPN